jgi:hypothetical protein
MYRVMRPAKIANAIVNYTRVGRVFMCLKSAQRLCRACPQSYVIDDHNHILFNSQGQDFMKLYGAP